MFPAAVHVLQIKDLKDLSVFWIGVSIDMQDLKDLKRHSFTVGRGPVPRHASVGTRNGLGRCAVFTRVVRSRGTGPRATGPEGVLSPCAVSGAGAPELQSPQGPLGP